MKKLTLIFLQCACCLLINAQKKVLDHSVYDSWQSISNILLSKDGKWIVYNIKVQEGDDELIIQSTDNNYKKVIPRGYDASITGDDQWLIFKIKPLYSEIRQAKIKKKQVADMPKDSLGIAMLGGTQILKYPNLVSYKTPREKNEWVAGLFRDTTIATAQRRYKADPAKDSLRQIIDSLQYLISTLKPQQEKDKHPDPGKNNHLLLMNPSTGYQHTFAHVNEYVFNKKGTHLLIEQTLNLNDTINSTCIIRFHLTTHKTDTIMRGGKDFKNLTLSEDGNQAAFVLQRKGRAKEVQPDYELWYYEQGMDSAIKLIDTLTPHFPKGYRVSEFAQLRFSTSGERLLFGTAPARPSKDTTIKDIDKVNLDIWHYKDDYLQPYQLKNQKRDREKSYLAVYDFVQKRMFQIGSLSFPNVYEGALADAKYFVAITDTGRRVTSQWAGRTPKDIYWIDIVTNRTIPVVTNLNGHISASWIAPTGKYVIWYNHKTQHYYSFDGSKTIKITSGIKSLLCDEENDVPDSPAPYGIAGWVDEDQYVLIYDRYDIWQVDPSGKVAPVNLTQNGRKNKITYRYISGDSDEKYIHTSQMNLLKLFDNTTKKSGLVILQHNKLNHDILTPSLFHNQPYHFNTVLKAKNAPVFAYSRESFEQSPNVYVYLAGKEEQLSFINPQQKEYNWGTASLFKWKTFSGKPATGILYKPENFDSTQKYPVILYFYEKLSDNLYKYNPPAPTPSRLNISFFVSRGYIVMTPDISYTIGHPAKSAYDYIVSGAKALTKFSWVDSKHMGLQGQSWGGIQVAQIITMTPMFAAAWAGAPVANMTSAYGGIRWSSGLNRQFQYEKTQSRIGATLWERPDLYIENSPLFHLPKVSTPLVIMANDNDGAVPWYQGIELFTGLRRLGKPVWMLNYNGEEHNLEERKNRKDIQIRQQQFFDWLLKGEKPAKWLVEGVPAVNKGLDWGLELVP